MTESGKRTLYRIPQQRKIAGVCAGVAEYFNLEPWLVRVVAASIFLLGGSGIVVIIYLLLWMILDVKPWTAKDTHKDIGVKKKVWQAGEPAKQVLRDVSNRFQSLEHRLRALEQHVTSEQFELKRQINNL
ncbi:envelope stress response membrane protein PspC [Shewanella algae]|uniref:envelope stress response membrane protein PspC n=1 Tax=Shewanella algae TaxID=38313 RepID=UPI001AAFEC15|nr:envelope stress response membrane protein PspC [Shewanella algae]MBO2591500.1 envelope stress response membrane protein PspC [Shewanella algae]